jgi:hypothetical protein
MKWYAAIVLHSEYLKRIARFTEPYGMLPASVYALDESDNPRFKEQVLNGIKLSERHYLRRFPVWYDFRGNAGTVLSQTKALSVAARLRRDGAAAELVQRQLQWAVGRTPFCQSLMYGEGHDYAPQYTAMSGDMVGALPVGIQTRENLDRPYWPPANCYNYKEVWVHPSSRWLAVLADVMAPPRQAKDIELTLNHQGDGAEVRVLATVQGRGRHRLALRTHNLAADQDSREVVLKPGQTAQVSWPCKVLNPREPWIAAVLPDGELPGLKDLVGGIQ